MKKRVLSILLGAAMATTLLAGCGGSKPADGKSEGGSEDHLVYWSMWEEAEPQGSVIKEIVDAYNKDAEVKIDLEFKGRNGIRDGLEPALKAGKHIDLYDESDERLNTVWDSYGYELSDLVESTGYAETANTVLLDSFKELAGGKLVAIPYQPYIFSFFYNKQIFNEAGVTEAPKTWDEFLDACEKIKNAGYIPLTTDDAYSVANFGTHLTRLVGQDRTVEIVKNGEWDDPAVVQVAEQYEELAAKGYISPNVETNKFPAGQNSEFALGEVAMYFDGSWVPNEVKSIAGEDFEWGCFSYPALEGGKTGTEAVTFGAQAIAINKNCKHPEEAFKFIEMLTKGEYDAKLAKESLGMPVSTATDEWPEQLKEAREVLENATTKLLYAAGGEANTDVIPLIKENFLKLMGGSITAEEFVANMSK